MLDGCLGVVVGDVSSHGMGPALLMSETRACLRTLAQIHGDVGEILTRANRLLAADTSDFHFVTLAMARLDPRDRSMVYASAGQRGYLLHAGPERHDLDSTSLPLGVDADARAHAAAVNCGRDMLLLHRRCGRGRIAGPAASAWAGRWKSSRRTAAAGRRDHRGPPRGPRPILRKPTASGRRDPGDRQVHG